MTPEQKAAYVNAQVQLMIAERDMMLAENAEREVQCKSPAYGSEQWFQFSQRWGAVIGHNALVTFFGEGA